MKLILPNPLLNEIKQLNLSKTGFNNALDFYYHYLSFSFQFKEIEFIDTYLPIPSTFLINRYTTNYLKKFLQPMLNQKIITRYPYYNSSPYYKALSKNERPENRPFLYKFRDDLLDFSDLTILDYFPKVKSDHNKKSINYAITDLNKLQFNEKLMIDIIKKISVNPVIVTNSEILTKGIIEIKRGDGSIARMDIYSALMIAKIKNVDLIEYKGDYHLMEEAKFRKFKNLQLQIYNCSAVTRIINKDYYAARNGTNFRLDTNLTNLSKIFFDQKCITLNGEPLTEIDLKNSQPTLLSFLLRNPECINKFKRTKRIKVPTIQPNPDVIEFIDLAEGGILYDYISKKTGITRDQAKKAFLKIMFSKPAWNDKIKTDIKSIFPSVVSWMDKFKHDSGDHTVLSVVLQRIESEIFIDNVYKELRRRKYTVYSKHDCILCKSSQYEEIKSIVKQELNEFGLKFKLS